MEACAGFIWPTTEQAVVFFFNTVVNVWVQQKAGVSSLVERLLLFILLCGVS
jgi:hypothetical protein